MCSAYSRRKSARLQTSGSWRKITVEVHPHPRAGHAGRRRARSMRWCAPGRAAFFCLVVLGPASSWAQVVPVETSDERLRDDRPGLEKGWQFNRRCGGHHGHGDPDTVGSGRGAVTSAPRPPLLRAEIARAIRLATCRYWLRAGGESPTSASGCVPIQPVPLGAVGKAQEPHRVVLSTDSGSGRAAYAAACRSACTGGATAVSNNRWVSTITTRSRLGSTSQFVPIPPSQPKARPVGRRSAPTDRTPSRGRRESPVRPVPAARR